MVSIRGIYEVAIPVKDLGRAEAFYCDCLGLEVGLRDTQRRWLFLRAGGRAGIMVLQEDPGQWPARHFAFAVDDAELERAAATLRAQGVQVAGPVPLEWVPARSIYFSDPDGHELELCAAAQ